jgi:hypothetical protein
MNPILAADELAWSVDYVLESTRFIQALIMFFMFLFALIKLGKNF